MKNMVTHVTRCKMQQFLTGGWNFAWSLAGYLLVTCSCSTAVVLCPIKEETDLDKNADALL